MVESISAGEATVPHVKTCVTLNRHLFEGNGDEFARLLADHIRRSRLHISKDALEELVFAITMVQN